METKYALAIAFARTNVPLSSERTWTLFHHPPGVSFLYLTHDLEENLQFVVSFSPLISLIAFIAQCVALSKDSFGYKRYLVIELVKLCGFSV